MDIMLDPNVAYLLLLAGLLLGMMGMLSPGTGLFEISSLFALFLAGYAVYTLHTNPWAFVVLAISVIPFVYATRAERPRREMALALSIVGFIVGSVILFTNEEGFPAVNPILATVVSVLFGGIVWISTRKSLEAAAQKPSHALERLIGMEGEAKTKVQVEGSVQVNGELWSARSEKAIPDGSKIRVVRREGLVLVVEKVE